MAATGKRPRIEGVADAVANVLRIVFFGAMLLWLQWDLALVAMVVAGEWCDRSGPRPAMLWGVVLFALGAVLGGLAWSMPVKGAARTPTLGNASPAAPAHGPHKEATRQPIARGRTRMDDLGRGARTKHAPS